MVAFRFFLIFLSLVLFDSGTVFSEAKQRKGKRILYPKKTKFDFDALQIEGELNRSGEFYFKYRDKEKFESKFGRRKNFHPEMLRDALSSQ